MDKAKNPDQAASGGVVQPPDPRIFLAVERTSLALERTQLAWVRTVISFIMAGFAIDKATAILHDARITSGEAWSKNGHFAGLLLTITSTALMIMVTIMYIRRMNQLNAMRGLKEKLPAPTTILSIFVCGVGGLTIYFLFIPW